MREWLDRQRHSTGNLELYGVNIYVVVCLRYGRLGFSSHEKISISDLGIWVPRRDGRNGKQSKRTRTELAINKDSEH